MHFINVADYSERQNRALQRILDQMDRCNTRTEQHYARLRRFERRPYRGPVTVFLPSPEQPDPPPSGRGCFTAWSYSLSQGGMGFVTPNEIDDPTVVVGVHLPDGAVRWFRGDVVRRREIPGEGFYDYGVAFHAARPHQPDEDQDADLLAAR
jgi:hypothetical protein